MIFLDFAKTNFFGFRQFLLACCISLYFCKQVFGQSFLYNLLELQVEIKNC